tara:strand:- start:119 stop:463 length:345 start_codon:yes stop_codon:yes gene_type:complete
MKIPYLALAAMLLCSSVGLAQEAPSPQGFPLNITVQCDTVEAMTDVLSKKYSEQPIATGTGMMVTNGQLLTGTMLLWGSLEKNTYSVTLDNTRMMCMIISGKEFTSAQPVGEPT